MTTTQATPQTAEEAEFLALVRQLAPGELEAVATQLLTLAGSKEQHAPH